MKKSPLVAAALVGILTLPLLQGCFTAVATGVAVGALSAFDRRSTGVQADDETTEWRAGGKVPAQYRDTAHVNFVSYNRALLVTGEAPNEEGGETPGSLEEPCRRNPCKWSFRSGVEVKPRG